MNTIIANACAAFIKVFIYLKISQTAVAFPNRSTSCNIYKPLDYLHSIAYYRLSAVYSFKSKSIFRSPSYYNATHEYRCN